MSRHGVTPSQIYRACEELAKDGVGVTVDAVRGKIGGSNSTLVPVVREWKRTNSNGAPSESDLPASVLEICRKVHEGYQADKKLCVQEAEQRAAEQIHQYRTSLSQSALREKALGEEAAFLRTQAIALQNTIEAKEAALVAAKQRISELEALVDHQAREIAIRDDAAIVAANNLHEVYLRTKDELRSVRAEFAEKLDMATMDVLELRGDKRELEARVAELSQHNLEQRTRSKHKKR